MIYKLHYFWIWFWYNTTTRILFVLIPGHFIFSVPLMFYLNVQPELFKDILIFSYIFVITIAIIDNDFSKLRKIGLDEYRKKLNT